MRALRTPLALVALATSGWLGLVAGLALVSAALLANEVQAALPPPTLDPAELIFQSSSVLDRAGGTIVHEIYDPDLGQRTVVPLSAVSPAVIAATIATEDADFYVNPGFELRGIGRSIYEILNAGRAFSGGSTITQQLARRVILSQQETYERTVTRKIKEIILAYQLTRLYPKDRILELYLNEIAYGNQTYGIEAAARGYFGKTARDVTLAEATFLAGLPQAPSEYDPRRHHDAARERQVQVIERMYARGLLTADEAREVFASTPPILPQQFGQFAPHFSVDLQGQLEDLYGADRVRRGGLRIVSTLDQKLQLIAESVTRDTSALRRRHGANNVAIVALEPRSGDILALVGSDDFEDTAIAGQVNMAATDRQPGTTLIPFAWTVALTYDQTLADPVVDETFIIANGPRRWQPENVVGGYRGLVDVRTAIHDGLIPPAARVVERFDPRTLAMLMTATGAPGLERLADLDARILVSRGRVNPVQLAAAYAMLANGGLWIEPGAIRAAWDGELALPVPSRRSRYVIGDSAAYQVLSALSREAADGRVDPGATIFVGHTEDSRDNWAIFIHRDLVLLAWVGNTDGERAGQDSSQDAAMMVRQIAERYALPEPYYQRPPSLTEVALCLELSCAGRRLEAMLPDRFSRTQALLLTLASPPTGYRVLDDDSPREAPPRFVPQVVGERFVAIERRFDLAGLAVRREAATPASQPPGARQLPSGTVVATDPPGGARVVPGTTVRVFVAP